MRLVSVRSSAQRVWGLGPVLQEQEQRQQAQLLRPLEARLPVLYVLRIRLGDPQYFHRSPHPRLRSDSPVESVTLSDKVLE